MSTLEQIGNDVTNIAKEVSKILEGNTDHVNEVKQELNEKIDNYKITSSRLYGKKFGMMGDSFVDAVYHPTAYANIAAKYNMQYFNYGKSGGCVGHYEDGNGNTLGAGVPMVDRYMNMRDDLDYIGFTGGTNDANRSLSFDVNDTTPNTFPGALKNICEGLINKYGGKKIFGVTPWLTSNSTYNERISNMFFEIVSRKYGIPVFDTRYYSGIYTYNQAFRNKYYMSSTDQNHLNVEGFKVFQEPLESFMLQL